MALIRFIEALSSDFRGWAPDPIRLASSQVPEVRLAKTSDPGRCLAVFGVSASAVVLVE